MILRSLRPFACAATLCAAIAWAAPAPDPIVLTGADRRPALSLDGDWATIVDPYFDGLFSFHHVEKKDGWFLNRKAQPGDPFPTEYDFSKAPRLKVPGDWNTQREALFNYEGVMWYQRDFDYQPREHHRVFFHIGAANYKAILSVNGKLVCEHEGGFTPFDCEVTKLLHPGKNFTVIAVDDTRQADGVPTLNTDWYNYGGLTRDVSLVEVPESFIDEYDLHLNPARTAVEGWVHLQDAAPGATASVSIPELKLEADGVVDSQGRVSIKHNAAGMQFWSPEQP